MPGSGAKGAKGADPIANDVNGAKPFANGVKPFANGVNGINGA